MDGSDLQKSHSLLEELRDGQKLQLQRQEEALALQREQLAIVQMQVARTERIQERAERIQATSARLIAGARVAIAILLPVILALIAYVSWLLVRRLGL